MNIHPVIEEAAFEPEAVLQMGRAYEAARKRLGTATPATVLETVAKRIVEAAKLGERDPQRLTSFALRGLDGHDRR
jgi:hypothetical protein